MSTSDLLSGMYQVPWKTLNQQQARLMHKLHSMPASPTTATYAQNAYSLAGSGPTSTSYIAPYLHRVYWVLVNSDGQYLVSMCGNVLQFASSPNQVPTELRFCSHEVVKQRWLAIKQLWTMDDYGIAIRPIDFYAHRSTPHLWCAND